MRRDLFFSFSKDKTYIQMVCDVTGSRLNKTILSSSFVLTAIDLVLRGVGSESYFGDK